MFYNPLRGAERLRRRRCRVALYRDQGTGEGQPSPRSTLPAVSTSQSRQQRVAGVLGCAALMCTAFSTSTDIISTSGQPRHSIYYDGNTADLA